MRRVIITTVILAVGFIVFFFSGQDAQAKTYTVGPNSKPLKGFNTNANNHGYFLIRSYMQKFEHGGGTLVLKKGTYKISNAIFVPSNVTIKFKSGVKLVKTNGPSSSMFQFLADSKYNSGRKNITSKYNGEHNIKFIGSCKVILDMKNKNPHGANAIGIVMANNKNVTIKGITFQNVKKGHMIEMDGCKKVTIEKCTFKNMKTNKYKNKEAINLDTNDEKTGSFTQEWSKKDKTPNSNVTIKKCTFKNLMRAVGTHRYSGGKYHTKIKFISNTVKKVNTPLGMLNWKNSTVKNNKFTNCKANSKFNYVIMMAGVKNMTFTNNTFLNCKGKYILKIYPTYQTIYQSYPATVSKLTAANLKALKKNYSKGSTKKKIETPEYSFNW